MYHNFKITVMKKKDYLWSLLVIVMAATLSVGLSSCKDDDDNPYLEEPTPSNFEIEIEGESDKYFDIKSNVNWKVSSDKTWIKVRQGQEEGGDNATIYFSVEKNENYGDARKGTITISSTTKGVNSRYVYITQKSKQPQFDVSPTSVSPIKGDGGTVNFNVTANLAWQVSSNQSWLTIDKNEGDGNGFVTATAEPNGTSSSRSATLTFSGKEGNASPITVTISQEPGGISVSPISASMLGEKGSTNTLTVTATGAWTLVGCPDWLHASATSGTGTTSITLTALTENWSDQERSATLTFMANTLSATATITQRGTLPTGLRVETSNITLMSDGFACDLTFGPNAKGYKEAFFTEEAMQTMTDHDIYEKLMEQTEYNSLWNYTFLPGWVDPNTKLIYCVAAYGNENNDDGTHRYGPITIEHVTTKSETIYDDMYLTASYNSSRWVVTAARAGNYGQRCDEYYYLAAEGDLADDLYFYANRVTYALLAHIYFKPMIAADENAGYLNGPQTLNFTRKDDVFFCTTWGIDRDTKEFSAELSLPVYYNLTSSSRELERVKSGSSDWNKPHRRPTQTEIQKMRNALKIIKVSK